MKYTPFISSLLLLGTVGVNAAAQAPAPVAQAKPAPAAAAKPMPAPQAAAAKPAGLKPMNAKPGEKLGVPPKAARQRLVRFKQLDANKDGKLSKDEFEAGQLQLWSKADINKDSVVTLAEAKASAEAARSEHISAHFGFMDDNDDGKLTPEEAGPMPAWRFSQLDTNRDYSVTLEEMQKAPFPAMHHAPGAAADTSPDQQLEHYFQEHLDKDNDGKLTKAEIQARPSAFEHLDADKDGALTPDEFFVHHGFLCHHEHGMPGKGPGPGHAGPGAQHEGMHHGGPQSGPAAPAKPAMGAVPAPPKAGPATVKPAQPAPAGMK